MTSPSPEAGRYPVPGPDGPVLREWDGQSWSDHYFPGDGKPLPSYQRHPLRWLAFPGWLLIVLYTGALGLGRFMTQLDAHALPVRALLALCIAAATLAPALGLLLLFTRRLGFAQLPDRGGIVAWGIGGGAASAVIAVLIIFFVSGQWRAPLLSSPGAPHWLVAVLQGGWKMIIPLSLWGFGKFRVPRAGFLLVLVTAMTFATVEAGVDGWVTAEISHQRGGLAFFVVLLSALAAAVPWRAAWRRRTIVTWAAIGAFAVATALHWGAEVLISNNLAPVALLLAVAGYFAVKVVARQLVPPDLVARVSPGWRPAIGTVLSPTSPLLSPRDLRVWLRGHRRHPVSPATARVLMYSAKTARALVRGLAALLSLAVVLAMVGVLVMAALSLRDVIVQRSLDAFYSSPDGPSALPAGTLIRYEPLTANGQPLILPGAHAYRMLYSTRRPDGEPAVSGGMAFIPDQPARGHRAVLAWAHPTLGEGDACAPSRSSNPLMDTQPWLSLALQRGWAVVATDYAGVGTPGTPLYLVGQSESLDVVNSVRAARAIPGADLGSDVAVFGHSQGGHSALWTGTLAPQLAPDITIVGVAAAAPAAELPGVFDHLWNGSQTWMLSPDVVASWTSYYPGLTDKILTPLARAIGPRQARACIVASAVESILLHGLGLPYTVKDPMQHPEWAGAAQRQTPPPIPADIPVLIGQSISDETIPAWTNGVLQQRWCAAGSRLDMMWLSGVSHVKTAPTMGPSVITWLEDRFAGRPTAGNCTTSPPVTSPTAPISQP